LFLPQNFWARSRFATPLWRAVANRCDAYPRLAACEADAMLTEPHACKVAALFRQAASGSTDHIEVSSVSAAEFARDDARFRDLIGRAAQPNVFMEPALLAAAEAADPDRLCIRVLLAWKIIGHQRTLVGSWAFAVRRDGIARLVSPAAPLAALATPVIDGGCLDNVLEAFLDAVARDPQLPNLMELDAVDNDGPIAAALRRVLSRRHAAAADVDARQRAQLISPLDGNSSLDRVLSTSRRARLRYYRRRLEKLGEVRHVVHETAPEVERGFEAFLELEAAGWKGRRGSAILSDERVARFARAAVAGLAANGLASISALYVEGRPVSMCVILKSGRTAYTWKIAYDESMGLFSPGQLLLENDTAWFLEHPELDRVDSTSARDVGIFAELWAERKLVVNLIVDARCASPLAARAAVLALAAFRLTSMLKARLRARERLAQMLRYRRP
jgi:CelD/BcsL family acetyltransferase involved in cellulose biosynthesis